MPAVLIVYTPSRASHVEAMVALAEYLRNYCAVEALLDQLDVPETETKVVVVFIKWARHTAWLGETKKLTEFCLGNLYELGCLEDLRRKIVKCVIWN